MPVYGRSVESILAAVAAERRGSGQGFAEGLDALTGLQGPGGGGGDDDALDLAFNQLPRWSLRGDSHAFDWSGATNYTALHLQARFLVMDVITGTALHCWGQSTFVSTCLLT